MLLKPFWDNFFLKDTATKEVFSALKENPLFSDCSNRELNKIMQIAYPRVYKQGEYIFSQNQIGLGMYVIISGSVSLSIYEGSNTGLNGSPYCEPIILNKNCFFGESALVEEDCIRTLNAQALEETRLISIFRPDLLDFSNNNREIGLKIAYRLAQILSKRLNKDFELVLELNRRLKELTPT